MAKAYLWLNALLYMALALWCTIAPASTAQAVGFTALTPAGWTEFLAVYGGMEFGIGLAFAYFSVSGQTRNGLVLALLFYAPIVAWRGYAIALHGLPGGTTLGLVVGEWLLLLAAAGLFLWQRDRAG